MVRPKNVHRQVDEAPPPPRSSGWSGGRLILATVALLALGASFAIIAERLVTGGNPASTASPSPSVALTSPSADASPSGSPAPTPSPSPSPSPAAPDLVALLPKSIDGTTLTIDSAKDTTSLGTGPAARALTASVKKLGKKSADFEIAAAYDPNGTLKVQVLGFRLPGVDPAKLEPIVLNAWLAADVPGVTKTNVKLAGHDALKVSYGDGGNDEYLLTYHDALFLIETADASLAEKAAAAIGTGSAGGSPAPSGSPSGSASPSPSPSPSPS